MKHTIRLLSRRGDTLVAEWTPGTTTEEEQAKTEFDKLSQLGYMLFAVETPGAVPEGPVRTFDPKQMSYVAVPQFKGG